MAYDIRHGDVVEQLQQMPDQHFHCCVTSPPYWGLRDYGVEGQIGLEETPDAYVERMVEVFREVRRVLRDDGTLWLNIGDSYTSGGRTWRADNTNGMRSKSSGMDSRPPQPDGLKPKDLVLIPYRLILALQLDGWYVRSQIVWAKKSSMPESVRDRPTSAWEPIFLLTKSPKYFYDAEAVKTPASHPSGNKERTYNNAKSPNLGSGVPFSGSMANLRNVWHLGPEPFPDAHFATFPTEIPRKAIRAGTSARGCCPECGAPWERVVEREEYTPAEVDVGVRNVDASRGDKTRKLNGADYNKQAKTTTTGWQPTCDCVQAGTSEPYECVPCRVLEPFAGSGTTLMVAELLGRDSVGIELNPEYIEIAERRIQKGLPLTWRKSDESNFQLQPSE